MSRSKVFGVGFPKTGTSSLARALRELGYDVTGPNGAYDKRVARDVHLVTAYLASRHDAFQDDPWPQVYREMDRLYPDAKFILTWRDPDRWIRSQVTHFGTRVNPVRQWVFGAGRGFPAGNESHYLQVYERHNEEVQEYFASRPGKLLVVNFEQGDGWERLCDFLECDVPDVPFPHANSVEERKSDSRLMHALRRTKIRWKYRAFKVRVKLDARRQEGLPGR